MKHYQIQIAEERRQGDRRTSTAIPTSLPDGVDAEGKPKYKAGPTKLYDMGQSINANHANDPQLLYIAEWDLVAPYVTILKGNHAERSLDYLGWPTVTKEEWDAANPAPV